MPFFAADLFGQGANMLWYNRISQEEGLSSQDYNFYVYVDSEGYTWISSTAGLNRFDGFHIKQYHSDFQDSTALFGENIQSRFFEDSRHNLWFCTYEAVHCYNRRLDNFQHFFIRNDEGGQIGEDYYVFQLEQDSILWLRADHGVYRVNINDPEKTGKMFETARKLFETGYFHLYTGLAKDRSVQYIFACSDDKKTGVTRFEIMNGALRNQDTFFDKSGDPALETGIYQVEFEDPENIWLTTGKGLARWSLSKRDKIEIFPFRFQGYAYFAPFGKQYLIVSFFGKGIFLFDKNSGRYTPFLLKPVKQLNAVAAERTCRNIYLDRNQVLWVSIPPEGVLYTSLQKRKFTAIAHSDSLRGEKFNYRNFIENKDGRIWCGYGDGILGFDHRGNVTGRIAIRTNPPVRISVNSILADSSGCIWAATNKGLFRQIAPDRAFQIVPGTKNTDFLYLYQLSSGQVLASSLYGEIFNIAESNGQWAPRSILKNNVGYTTIYEDRRRQVYICRNEVGIDVFDYKKDTLIIKGTLPVRGSVNAWFEDPDGQHLWVGTSFGLAKVNMSRFADTPLLYNEKDGLLNNNVMSIVSGDAGHLWLGTGGGLASFYLGEHTFRNYSMADGMLSDRFDKFSGLKLKSTGDIWLGGAGGVTVVPSRRVPDIDTKAGVLLTEIKVNDGENIRVVCSETGTTDLNKIQHLEFPYSENTLSFSFVAVDYADPAATQVAYLLKGVDKAEVKGKRGEAGFARYPNLSDGDYVFMIRGANSDGIWNETPHRLIITILPPYWATWWFRSLIAAAILALIFAGVSYRINQIRKTEQLKRRIAENKMSALIAQMNPHFIFNSLQSINSYILKNNRKQASEYLGRFSRLMRMILENSRRSMHSLEKERELLELYLKVESQRFKEPFLYKINIDESLDTYETQLPCMMLQPFVENAIWHGLSHKKTAGTIQIDIGSTGALLKCTVTDNGVGRQKAAEIALKKGRAHESKALQILSERLELLFPGQQHLCAIEYSDLLDEFGEPAGTKVEISLPILAE